MRSVSHALHTADSLQLREIHRCARHDNFRVQDGKLRVQNDKPNASYDKRNALDGQRNAPYGKRSAPHGKHNPHRTSATHWMRGVTPGLAGPTVWRRACMSVIPNAV